VAKWHLIIYYCCALQPSITAMRLIAFDTSTEYLSLALWHDGKVSARDQLAGQTHSSLILPQLREMLDEAGLELKDFDGIAFGAGPGSFTGLRIGCGVAQGLAFGAGLPVLGVSTLLALAAACDQDKVIACLDARMGEVYHAAYVRQRNGWATMHAPGLYAPQTAPVVDGGGWFGIGSGWRAYGEVLATAYAGHVAGVDAAAFPHAREMVALAVPLFAQGLGKPAHEAAPVYIRNKVAFTMSERAKA
jgi:tRNA threonylcarbamoyladenosine biosynthesis protein TsaB